MKKTLITSATAFAIVLSAGMSMAGPLRDHGQRGNAHDVRSTVSQAFNHADKMAKTHQSTNMSDHSFDVTSKQDPGQTNLFSNQQQSTYGTNWSSELPSVVAITVTENGNTTWIIGKTTGSDLQPTPMWKYYR